MSNEPEMTYLYGSQIKQQVNLYLNRDQSGMISSITGVRSMTATFNPDLEITSVQHLYPQPYQEAYTFDERGNRLTSFNNAYIYDYPNQLLETATHIYQY